MRARPKRRSVIWFIPTNVLKELVNNSDSISGVLRVFDMENKGGNYKTLKARLLYDRIDFSHIKMGLNSNVGRNFQRLRIPLEKILVKGSAYSRNHLKRRLIEGKILRQECYSCGQRPMWKGNPLSLVLDHINGDPIDNRLENLRLLCPNCNSQTPTFCGKNVGNSSRVEHQTLTLDI